MFKIKNSQGQQCLILKTYNNNMHVYEGDNTRNWTFSCVAKSLNSDVDTTHLACHPNHQRSPHTRVVSSMCKLIRKRHIV